MAFLYLLEIANFIVLYPKKKSSFSKMREVCQPLTN
jgi:hypothetical protein